MKDEEAPSSPLSLYLFSLLNCLSSFIITSHIATYLHLFALFC